MRYHVQVYKNSMIKSAIGINALRLSDAYMRQQINHNWPLSEAMREYC